MDPMTVSIIAIIIATWAAVIALIVGFVHIATKN